MEQKERKSFVEMRALKPVAPEEKRSWLSVMLVQAGCMIAVTSLMLGSLLAESLSFTMTVVIGFLGYAGVAALMALVGVIGAKLGVPTCVVASSSFGDKGSQYVVSIIFSLCLLAWFAMQNTICGQAFSGMMLDGFGIDFPVNISIIMWGLIMMATSIIGFGAMDILNRIALPLLLIFMAMGCVLAYNHTDNVGEMLNTAPHTISAIECLGMVIGFSAFSICVAPDCTRYQRTVKETVLANGLGISGGGFLMLVIGAFLSKLLNEYDVSVIMLKLGFPLVGMMVLVLVIWTSNVTNIWSAGLNVVMIFNLNDKYRWVVSAILGVFGTIASLFGWFDNLSSFIDMLSIVFLPITGVFVADFYIRFKGDVAEWKTYKGFNWKGFAATILGGIVCYLLMSVTGFNGLIGGVVSVIAYLVVAKIGNDAQHEGLTIAELAAKE